MQRKAQASLTPKLRAAWVKAGVEGQVEFQCANKAEAHRLRFALYAAVRVVKSAAGAALFPAELVEAAQACVVQVEGPLVRVIRAELTGIAQVLGALEGLEIDCEGVDLPPVSSPVVSHSRHAVEPPPESPAIPDETLAASQAALLSRIESLQLPESSGGNPYYKR